MANHIENAQKVCSREKMEKQSKHEDRLICSMKEWKVNLRFH